MTYRCRVYEWRFSVWCTVQDRYTHNYREYSCKYRQHRESLYIHSHLHIHLSLCSGEICKVKYLSHNLSQKKMEQGSSSLCPELQYQCSRSSTLLLQFLQSKENRAYEIWPISRQDQQTSIQQKQSGVKYKCWLFVIAQLILLLTTQSWTPKSMQSCQKIDVQCQPEAAAWQTAKQASQAQTEMLHKLCHQFY